ncbi:DUF6715 family protein [Butyrivibrio sp. MC2013]|uniref:DUF6715 family protein n=1 Tax=Butyrivibrio sp. MC2013 TaxID=1280686 RepID=UPI00041168EC|nr:DUF6715 family protein [Butyrivibrio sp. MC2013]
MADRRKKSRLVDEYGRETRMAVVIKAVVMAAVGAALVWAVWVKFFGVVSRNPDDITRERASKLTELESLLSMNLTNAYPGTPEGVVALYARISKAAFNEDYTDEEGKKLFKMEFELFDQELRDNQGSEESFLTTMLLEAKSKKTDGISLANYFLDDSEDTKLYEIDGRTFSAVGCRIVMKKGNKASTYRYDFTMRQDTESGKNWRILGWEVSEDTDTDTTSVEDLCNMDLQTAYPADPWDVADLFARVTATLYNEEYSDADMRTMGDIRAALYDDELLANQTDLEGGLAMEVAEKKNAAVKVANYVTDDKSKFVFEEVAGQECSRGRVMFSMRSETSRKIVYYDFILRKDDQGRWKILGWETAEE